MILYCKSEKQNGLPALKPSEEAVFFASVGILVKQTFR